MFNNLFNFTSYGLVQKGANLKLLVNYLTTIRSKGVSYDPDKYEAWPNMAIDSQGRLYIVYRTCDTNTHVFDATGKIVMRISDDEGEIWGDEITVCDNPEMDDRDGNILISVQNGVETILVGYNSWDGTDRYVYCRKSTVNSPTIWSAQIDIYVSNSGITRGNPILLSNGNILLPFYYTNINYVSISDDGGDTWSLSLMNNTISQLSEQSILEVKTSGEYVGRIISIFRQDTTPYYYYTSYSDDYGLTWSTPIISTNLLATYPQPVSLLRVNTNTLLMFGGDVKGFTYKSTNEGETWEETDDWRDEGIISARSYVCAVNININTVGAIWCTNSTTSDILYSKLKLSEEEYSFSGLNEKLSICAEFDEGSVSDYAFGNKRGDLLYVAGGITFGESGITGKCYSLNGIDSVISHQTLLDIVPDNYSISIWFNPNNISTTNAIWSKVIGASNRMFLLIKANGVLTFDYSNGSGYTSIELANGILTDNWYNVIVSISKLNGMKTWLNFDTQKNEPLLTAPITGGTNYDFTIGSIPDLASMFSGKIGQFSFRTIEMNDLLAASLYNDGNGFPSIEW